MGKVVIDYEGFKDVLGNYLSKNFVEEVISCMNDNLVFIEDIDEGVSEIDEKISAMRETRKALKEIKHIDAMYLVKEQKAKKLGCKHYIHCEMNDLYLFYLREQGFKAIIGNGGGEYVITSDNYLIDVTGNSLSAIEKEACLGTAAYGYIGIVEDVWHTDRFGKLHSETDMQPKRITVFDLLRNITSVKYFTNQIFSLIQGINSEEELLGKLDREFSKEQAAVVISAAKKGYPLSLEGLQK